MSCAREKHGGVTYSDFTPATAKEARACLQRTLKERKLRTIIKLQKNLTNKKRGRLDYIDIVLAPRNQEEFQRLQGSLKTLEKHCGL